VVKARGVRGAEHVVHVDEKYIPNFWSETLRKDATWKTSVDGKIILKWILSK